MNVFIYEKYWIGLYQNYSTHRELYLDINITINTYKNKYDKTGWPIYLWHWFIVQYF